MNIKKIELLLFIFTGNKINSKEAFLLDRRLDDK